VALPRGDVVHAGEMWEEGGPEALEAYLNTKTVAIFNG
jgi:hypothetical protein